MDTENSNPVLHEPTRKEMREGLRVVSTKPGYTGTEGTVLRVYGGQWLVKFPIGDGKAIAEPHFRGQLRISEVAA